VYFPLHPDTPAGGLALEDLFAGRGYDLDAMHARMQQLMDVEGLPYRRRTHTYNSRLAQELAKWADGGPGGAAVHDALYKTYFVEGRNLADAGVLVDAARSAGVSTDEAQKVLRDRTFKGAVDADWEKARQYGINAVPSFAAGGYKLIGAHPYEVLAQFAQAAGAHPTDDSRHS